MTNYQPKSSYLDDELIESFAEGQQATSNRHRLRMFVIHLSRMLAMLSRSKQVQRRSQPIFTLALAMCIDSFLRKENRHTLADTVR